MATPTGENRQVRVAVDGTRYLYNPNTGRWFTMAGEPVQTTVQFPEGGSPVNAPVGFFDSTGGEAPADPVKNDLFAAMKDLLSQFNLATPGLLDFATEAIKKGWGVAEFMLQLRSHPDYLANPLFAANVERAKQGYRFMPEAEVIGWATEAKRMAKQFGFQEPSDSFLAQGLGAGLSLSEIEHRLQIEQRVQEYGGGVKWIMENEYGLNLSDQDLSEIFDPEKDTAEWDEMIRRAETRGRPQALGLGIRSEAEAQMLQTLGVSADEAYQRYEGVAANASRFDRLASIEGSITGQLPDDFGSHLAKADNSLLVKALVFNNPEALAEIQQMTAREVARFRGGGGIAGGGVGLLAPEERR